MALTGSITTKDGVTSSLSHTVIKMVHINEDLSAIASAYIYKNVESIGLAPMEKLVVSFTFSKLAEPEANAFAQAQNALKASTAQSLQDGTPTTYVMAAFDETEA